MCGIFGYYDKNSSRLDDNVLYKMGQSINHRGPDGQGIFYDPVRSVALGNQRLAILDIEHGDQPFYSSDNNIVVVQNGEIFNHVELAEELSRDGYNCHTHCDTEVILRIYERDGIDGISKLNGMFAIAIYDRNLEALYLVRDRVGEKPLHYFSNNEKVVFSSEIKSILSAVPFPGVEYQAINDFLAFNYVPPPLTMFKDIKHVMPGHWLKITDYGIEEHCWWDISEINVEEKSEERWIEEFNHILDDAVKNKA